MRSARPPELLRLHVTNRPRVAHTQAARNACAAAAMDADDTRAVVDATHRALACTRVMGDAVRAGLSNTARRRPSSRGAGADAGGAGATEEDARDDDGAGGGSAHDDGMHAALQRAVERRLLEGHVDALAGCLGACERILNAPVPLSYSRHTSRFLSIWRVIAAPHDFRVFGRHRPSAKSCRRASFLRLL